MHVNFSPVDENFIKRSVEGGLYGNATELVRDAVRRLRENEEQRHAELVAALQLGENDIANGRTKPYTKALMKEIRERVISRAAAGEKPKSDDAS